MVKLRPGFFPIPSVANGTFASFRFFLTHSDLISTRIKLDRSAVPHRGWAATGDIMAGGKGWLGRLLMADRADRRPASQLVAYQLKGLDIQKTRVRDISASGAYLITGERLPVGTSLSLTMQQEGPLERSASRRITQAAQVARQGKDGLGIEFIVPADSNARRWSDMIESLAEQTKPYDMLGFLRMVEGIRFLSRVCPRAPEDFAQLFHGLSNHKIANAVEIAMRADNLLSSEPAPERLGADPSLVIRILEVGSSLDQDWLRNQWGGLLSACCRASGSNETDLLLVDLFAQLTAPQVRIVTSICTRTPKQRLQDGALFANSTGFTIEELACGVSLREAQIERDLEILSEIGLVKKGFDDSRALLMSDRIDLAPTHLALELHCRCQGHRGSPEEFYS
jgi:hypothetical protein